MSSPMERAAAMARQARDKLKASEWTIQRPGEEAFTVTLNPPQDFTWVSAHYCGAKIVQGHHAP